MKIDNERKRNYYYRSRCSNNNITIEESIQEYKDNSDYTQYNN